MADDTVPRTRSRSKTAATAATGGAKRKPAKTRAGVGPGRGAPPTRWDAFANVAAEKVRPTKARAGTAPEPSATAPRFAFEKLHRASPVVRADLVKEGAPAALLVDLAAHLRLSRHRLYETIGVARATADRKVKAGARLDADASERAMGLARLVGQVEAIVRESGDPAAAADFDAAAWVADFLDHPHPALGGRRPADLMDTADGRTVVSDLVAQMQTGAYA